MKEYLSNNNSNTKIKEHVSNDKEHMSMQIYEGIFKQQ